MTKRLAMALLAAALWMTGCGKPSLPELTPALLAEARARWEQAHVASYDLDLKVEGTQLDRAAIHIEVRADSVRKAERDGIAMTGDTSAYAVPGLFRTLEQELAIKANPAEAGAPAGYQVYVQATFDPERGYPLHYRRIVGGSNTRVEMTVVRFTAQ